MAVAASSRREFLRLAVAAGLLGPAGFGCRGTAAGTTPPRDPPPEPTPQGTDHLARGLAAMADAHHRGWVPGHYGAAVIASHYFSRDNGLDERTTRALRAQVDAFIGHRPSEFPRPDPGRGAADPARIAEQLDLHVSELRSGGHGTIYASLALRALRDLPEFATPAVLDGICALLEKFAATASVIPRTQQDLEHPLPPYRDAGDVAAVTLRSALRPWGDVRRLGASGVLHWMTHAEALLTLEELGHGEVARRGQAAHRQQINRSVEVEDAAEPQRPPLDWLGPEYWESDAPRRAQGGTWLTGHSFKLPYSVFRLLRRVDDPALRSAGLSRAADLLVPFG
jgi:hypothetical protein